VKVAVLAAVVAAAVIGVVVAASAHAPPAPTAVARVLPKGFRLLETGEYHHGALRVANYGRRGRVGPGEGPVTVLSVRGRRRPPVGYRVTPEGDDRQTTVRGHRAVLRTLNEDDQDYAHELLWRERRDLVVVVDANVPLRVRKLRAIDEHVQLLDRRTWARLHMQTSYAAQTGRASADMPRVRVRRERLGRRRWTLYALIPPGYPLSRDDLRVSCTEVSYRDRRRFGEYCGTLPNWRRVGGAIFVFGEVGPHVKHVRIRPLEGHAFDLRVRTARARRGPRVRYFAAPLPAGSCDVIIRRAGHPHEEGVVAGPQHGRDAHRCGRRY
jgi:hypothetical protein